MSPRSSLLLATVLGALIACERSNASATPAVTPTTPTIATPSTGGRATDPSAGHASHAHDVPVEAQPAIPAATVTANESAHGTGGHAHGSPHGGVVVSAPGGGHIEAKLDRSGQVSVWLLDDHEQTVTAQGARGTVRLAAVGAQDVPLALDVAQNALVGRVPAPTTDHVVGLVTVTYPAGRTATVRVTFHLESGGH